MNDDWLRSAAARRILLHWKDPRPAWLWSPDGTLLWRNQAAPFFGARVKKSGLRLGPPPTPIRGQIARAIRLGLPGRSSLSRMQFLAGQRPVSATTIVTPLVDAEGRPVALVVGVDAVAPDILAEAGGQENDTVSVSSLLPHEADFIVTGRDGTILDASPGAAERFGGDEGDSVPATGGRYDVIRFTAGPQGEKLAIFLPTGEDRIARVRAEDGLSARDDDEALPDAGDADPADTEAAPMSLPTGGGVESAASATAGENGRLAALFDRLADTEALYRGLPEASTTRSPAATASSHGPGPDQPQEEKESAAGSSAQDGVQPAELPPEPPPPTRPHIVQPEASAEPDVIAAVIEFEDDLAAEQSPSVSFRVIGRGFVPGSRVAPPPDQPSLDDVEQASRYNFSELSRILSDRVASELPSAGPDGASEPRPVPARQVAGPAQDGALINIAGETFILNRLPLGILVFRDQQVLFANRALTDLLGYGTIDSLRDAGLFSIFPSDDPATTGPVTQLVRSDGTVMPVTARLQSVTWQGRPAVMLSAMRAEQHLAHEIAVRNFAAAFAKLRDEGYVALDRAGLLADLSPRTAALLGPTAKPGVSLGSLLDSTAARQFRDFLERPARFAETERPSIVLTGPRGASITLFAEGVAGIVNGYFGLVSAAEQSTTVDPQSPGDDPLMLARVSRGVRRPLNTIIGFADLIRSAAFGTIENQRYLEYARDIKTAGQEIAVLVDEIEDYARLQAGTFNVRPAELDLAALLESCVTRVRGQANAARVLVRTAISEDLPRVRADRASLGQAVLNLLTSAIDQTPPSGSVILSSQQDDTGGIVINIRDSGAAGIDPGERFVVFRDGVGRDGEALAPVRSSVGLALTRSLIAVNACTLTVTPAGAIGTIFSVTIPPDLVGPAEARSSR